MANKGQSQNRMVCPICKQKLAIVCIKQIIGINRGYKTINRKYCSKCDKVFKLILVEEK